MAKIKNELIEGASGKIGKNLVYKTRNNKTFVSKYPDMSQVIPSKNQTKNRSIFGDAVKYARDLINDPVRAAAFKLKKGETLYLAAIKQYMQFHLTMKTKDTSKNLWQEELVKLGINERQIKTALFIHKAGLLTNADCRNLHQISKATATRDIQVLIGKNIIEPAGSTGISASYTIGSWWAQNE